MRIISKVCTFSLLLLLSSCTSVDTSSSSFTSSTNSSSISVSVHEGAKIVDYNQKTLSNMNTYLNGKLLPNLLTEGYEEFGTFLGTQSFGYTATEKQVLDASRIYKAAVDNGFFTERYWEDSKKEESHILNGAWKIYSDGDMLYYSVRCISYETPNNEGFIGDVTIFAKILSKNTQWPANIIDSFLQLYNEHNSDSTMSSISIPKYENADGYYFLKTAGADYFFRVDCVCSDPAAAKAGYEGQLASSGFVKEEGKWNTYYNSESALVVMPVVRSGLMSIFTWMKEGTRSPFGFTNPFDGVTQIGTTWTDDIK